MFKCDVLKWKVGGVQSVQVEQKVILPKVVQTQKTEEKTILSLSNFSNMVKRMVDM